MEKILKQIAANVELVVEYSKRANERLSAVEHRLSLIERHVGLNGRLPDTEPAPATEPENASPGEG